MTSKPKQGWMWKQGQMRKNWKRRWFVLVPGSPAKLQYFDKEEGALKRRLLGELQFGLDAKIELLPENALKRGRSAASEWRFAVTGHSPRRLLMAVSSFF